MPTGGDSNTAATPMRAVRSTSTMAFTYEQRRASKQPEEPAGNHDMIMLGHLHFADPDTTLLENEPTVFSSSSVPAKRKTLGGRLTVALGATTPITSHLTTHQLLQTNKADIPPDTSSGISLKLDPSAPEERLELIVDPAPANTDEAGNRSMFNFLGGDDGAKQPSLLFGSVDYVIDYLVAPHAGTTSGGATRTNLQKLALKRPSVMSGTATVPVLMPSPSSRPAPPTTGFPDDFGALSRTVVRDNLPLWVKSLWDSFLLTYKDGMTVLEFVQHVVRRIDHPGGVGGVTAEAVQQSAFETKEGHLVVASRRTTAGSSTNNNASMNRSARAVLMWMGIYQNHRNQAAIRTNSLLLLLHWLKTGSGAVDLAENAGAFQLVHACVTQHQPQSDAGAGAGWGGNNLLVMRLIQRELFVVRDVCGMDAGRVRRCLGLDFRAGFASTDQHEDLDQLRMRELVLCMHPYSATEHPVPKWARTRPIFSQPPELVASILTLLTYDLVYRHIHPLMLATDAARQTSQPVQDMVRLFKVFSYWPVTCILEEDLKLSEVQDRAVFFLAVCEHLRRLANFHGLFALMGGLTQPYLAWVWASLPTTAAAAAAAASSTAAGGGGAAAHHTAAKRFDDLKRLISNNGDYRVYRADLSHCQGKSRIPFLGVTLRQLVQLEDLQQHKQQPQQHPHLYAFSRQLTRSALINDYVGGQRHPYQCVNGTAFSIVSGPPGPSPYLLVEGGTLAGSKYAQFPPSSVAVGVYAAGQLGTGLETEEQLRVVPSGVEDKRAYAGSVELLDDLDLKLALCYSISITQEDSALRDIAKDVERSLTAV